MSTWLQRGRWAGLTGAGLAAGVAVQHAVARRLQRGPERPDIEDLAAPAAMHMYDVAVSDGGSIRAAELDGSGGRRGGVSFVLMHGITLSSAVWHYQLRDLAARGHRVVAVDFRGHGGSVAGADGLGLDRLAQDMWEVLAKLDLDRVVLVGHSMGGMVALRMLADDPAAARSGGGVGAGRLGAGRVGALALVATSANPVRHRGLPGGRGLVGAARPLLMRSAAVTSRLPGPTLPASDLAYLLARVTFGKEASPGEVAYTGGLTAEVPLRVSAQLMAEIVRFDSEATLGDIRLPTAVIVGEYDLQTPLAHAESLAAGIPGAELLVLRGCGHMVMLERRPELAAALIELAAEVR